MKLTKKERIRNAVCAAVSILAFLTIWQLATMFSHLGELIPSPHRGGAVSVHRG